MRGTQSPVVPCPPSTFGWRFVNSEQQGPAAMTNMPLPTATVAVDANHDGHANYFYTGVDLNHDGIPDALQGGTQTVGGPVSLGATQAVPRRSSIQRRDFGAMSSALSPQPAMAITSGPSRRGMLNRSASGNLVAEQTTVTVPATLVSPRASASSSYGSTAAGYGLRLHTGAQRPTEATSFASGVTCSPAIRAPTSPRTVVTGDFGMSPRSMATGDSGFNMVPISPRPGSTLAPVSPRQSLAAFSELIPPHSPLATPMVGSGIVVEMPRSLVGAGPPASLPGSVKSAYRSVSPM